MCEFQRGIIHSVHLLRKRVVGRAFQLVQTFLCFANLLTVRGEVPTMCHTMPHLLGPKSASKPPLFAAASDISFIIVIGEKASTTRREDNVFTDD